MSVPIIGQPKFLDWFFTITIECQCGKPLLYSGRPGVRNFEGTVVMCAGCKTAIVLTDIPRYQPDGTIHVPYSIAHGD